MSLMFGGTAYAAKRAGRADRPTPTTRPLRISASGRFSRARRIRTPARAFIDFYMTQPEAHARFAHEMGYATSNAAAGALLDPADQDDLLSTPAKLGSVIRVDYAWLADHRSAVINRFQSWVAS